MDGKHRVEEMRQMDALGLGDKSEESAGAIEAPGTPFLDDLKIGLLSGNFDSSTVSRLRAAAADLKSSSGDAGLDAVLSEIELRVEVELAKAGQY